MKKLLSLLALTLCTASSTWADVPQVNNVYQISTPEQLVEFATVVSTTTNAKAVLTADITLTSAWATPIGTESAQYTGTFDGQGHSITGFNLTTNGQSSGLFGSLGNKAVVKNFTIEGTISSKHQYVGVIGSATGTTVNISDIHSKLNITSSVSRVGGILGAQTGNGTININRCRYSGTFSPSVAGNFGGIIGLTYNTTSAYVNITDCLFDGTISFTGGSNTNAGGFVGYTRSCHCTIQNCFSNGSISADDPGQFVGQLNKINNNSTATNFKFTGRNYYVSGTDIATGTGVRDESSTTPETVSTQLTSGELCYALNGNAQGGVWRQTLTTDAAPTILDTSHKKLYKWHGVLYNDVPDLTISNEDDMLTFAAIVNGEANTVNAELDQNITLTSWPKPIGDWSTGTVTTAYKGHFNGNGRTITLPTVTSSQNYFGLFGVVSAATIENFSIRGSITNNDYTNIGVIGYSRDTEVNIQNIQSYLTITNNGNDKNAGGILGSGNAGTTNVNRCTFFGTINANEKTNAGGIVGYFANGSGSIVNITNCLFDGTITSEISNSYCGGIAGYGGANVNSVKIINCLSLGTLTAPVTGQFFGNIRNTGSSITNCYYQGDNIYGTGSSALTSVEATPVTNTQLSSGEICYLLNESTNAGTNWHQTLPADTKPTLDSTHGLVYVNGTVCPDTGTPQGTVSYSNADGTTVGEHVPVDGFCTYCGTFDASYLSANSDGFYEISNKEELVWFAALVNAGTYNAKAKLTADIDMDGADISHFPIGDASATSKYFVGTFDGQGHKLSNFQLVNTSAPTNYGMFNATTGVVLKNFWLDSSCEIHGAEMVGLIGHLYAGGTLEGIGNCADVTGIQNNIGGLIGGVTGNSSSKKDITIKNCWTTGKVETTNPSASKGKDCGALTGWFNNAKITIEGFWTVADVVNPYAANMYVYRNGGGASFTIMNSFSKNGEQTNYTNFTDEQLENGWLCYGLNGDQSNIAWYQTIGTDDYPVLDNSSKQVYELTVSSAGYASFVPTVNIAALPTDVIAYVGQIQNNGATLHLEEVTALPADNAFVVKADEGAYYYNGTSESVTLSETNNLQVAATAFNPTTENTIYCLAKKTNGVGFYPVATTVTIPARKVYLEITSGETPVKGFYGFEEDNATGISDLNVNDNLNDAIYNLAGQRISKMQKGINIVNGKKILK